MPQITTSYATLLAAVLLTTTLAGCGDINSQANFDAAQGKHISGWLPADHAQAAWTDSAACTECHGGELTGGIATVSCTSCHLGSPTNVHPLAWGDYGYARHPEYVATTSSGTSKCANATCHGPTLSGVAGSGPACDACHLQGLLVNHPTSWTQYSGHADYVQGLGYNSSSCSTAKCHGTDARGVLLSGPSCYSCHPADPADLTPVPDKHPHGLVFDGKFDHKPMVTAIASCWTNICHGTSGTGVVGSGPKCFNNTELNCHLPE